MAYPTKEDFIVDMEAMCVGMRQYRHCYKGCDQCSLCDYDTTKIMPMSYSQQQYINYLGHQRHSAIEDAQRFNIVFKTVVWLLVCSCLFFFVYVKINSIEKQKQKKVKAQTVTQAQTVHKPKAVASPKVKRFGIAQQKLMGQAVRDYLYYVDNDVNNDGKKNCQDYSIIYCDLYNMAYGSGATLYVVWNERTDFSHMLVKVNGTPIEPGATEGETPSEYWGADYDYAISNTNGLERYKSRWLGVARRILLNSDYKFNTSSLKIVEK